MAQVQRSVWFACALLAACGDNGDNANPDAPVAPDAAGPVTVFGGSATVYGQTVKTYGLLQGGTLLEAGFIVPKAVGAAADAQPAGTFDGFGPLEYPAEVTQRSVLTLAVLDFFRDGIGAPWGEAFFGVHSYMIDDATRLAVVCPATVSPAAAEVPAMYNVLPQDTYPAGGCIAGEGLHAVDLASPEMQTPAQPFTVNLWLAYSPTDGHMTVLESFVSDSFLSTGTSYDEDVRAPATYPPAASGKLFPGKLHAKLDGSDWKIYFDSFITAP